MDLNEAAVFVKVVQAGSFSAAARQLGLPASTVSTRVARLEQRLGATLLQRTTRRLHLTEAGSLYFEQAATGLGYLQEAEAAVKAASGEIRGRLRVTAPADLGDALLSGLVCRLHAAHPALDIELLLTDRFVDLVAEGIDVAIRTGALKDSTLVARRVGIACWAIFASPQYLSKAPPVHGPADLGRQRCLQFTPLGRDHWTLFKGNDSISLPMPGHVLVNNFAVVREMTLAGEGIGLLPTYMCVDQLASGTLVRVLPDWHGRADPVHLVYPRQRFVPPKLRAFIDIAGSELQRWLDQA